MFSLTVVAINGVHSYISLDNVAVRYLYATGTSAAASNSTSGSSTASAIIQCEPGSRVHPQHGWNEDKTYLAEYTSFSGYQLPGQDG